MFSRGIPGKEPAFGTKLNPDKAGYIEIRNILKWRMYHQNSKNVDPPPLSLQVPFLSSEMETRGNLNTFHLSFWNAHYRDSCSIYQMRV